MNAQSPPTAQPAQPMQLPLNTPLTVTLVLQDWQIVIAGLGKLPLEAGLDVWMKLQQQLQPQAPQRLNGGAPAAQPQPPAAMPN